MRHVGRPLLRVEDNAFVTGAARFVRDLDDADALVMRVVRSPLPHGRVLDVIADDARLMPGVVEVFTAESLGPLPPVPLRHAPRDSLEPYLQPPLAADLVRYAGEPLAAVFAETAGEAEDAAEAVELVIEGLPPTLSAVPQSPAQSAARDDRGPVEIDTLTHGFGDLHGAFHHADHIVERAIRIGRDGALPLETRGLLAAWDAGRQTMTLWGSTRVPHANRDALAAWLDLPSAAVVLAPTAIGGAFGVRGELGPEELLACLAAQRLGRSIKWAEEQREHLLTANQGRGVDALARAALDGEGRLLGLDVELWLDQGAYLRPEGLMVPELLLKTLAGPYGWQSLRATLHVRLTHRTPAGSVRGAGRTEATFIRERVIDQAAEALGHDPLVMRVANLLSPETTRNAGAGAFAQPLTDAVRAEPLHSRSEDAGATPATPIARMVERARSRFSLGELEGLVDARRERGELVGLGTALFSDPTASGPFESAHLEVDRAGHVTLHTAATAFGQGIETALAQIVADIVGVDYDRVRVVAGQTERPRFGEGSTLSRSTALAGSAAQLAAEALRDTILAAAAGALELTPDRLVIQSGVVRDADRKFGRAVELGTLARALEPGGTHPAEAGTGLAAHGYLRAERESELHGFHAALVEVDPLTGLVRVPHAFVAVDVGNAINPKLISEQLAGGVLMGLSHILYPALAHDGAGGLATLDYDELLLPTAMETPRVSTLICEDCPNPDVPLGIKGAGTAGIVGLGAAVAAGLDAALGAPGFTAALPVTPQKIRAHLRRMNSAA